ncbi:DNA repair protein RAD51 homolog 4-like isoform X2 [Apostichopus japonicus]|uniref:DNA repair protein RAD51 homolog 4-like isoform X2 n=1 Tax=Stichopus japonicus TaxID=307972 RepID=UPI003AB3B7E0
MFASLQSSPIQFQKVNTCDDTNGQVSDFIAGNAEELARKCSISYKVLLSIRKVLFAHFAAIPISGANLYQEVISSVAILQTGCKSLDRVLDGGLYTCELVEMAGFPKAGKTQLCHSVASTVAVESKQGVLYIDTTGGFSGQRLNEILDQKGCTQLTKQEALQRIQCKQVFDIYDLLELLEEVRGRLEQGQDGANVSFKMVIVDSVSSLLAPLLGGNQVDGQALIGHLAQALKVLPVEFYTSVLVTNTVVQGESWDEKKPALGRSWQSVPHTRIMIKQDPAVGIEDTAVPLGIQRRKAVIIKSQRQPTGTSASFVISERGVTDPQGSDTMAVSPATT